MVSDMTPDMKEGALPPPPMAPPLAWSPTVGATVVMSWMLARRLSFLFCELRRMKYFCAWLATCGASTQ